MSADYCKWQIVVVIDLGAKTEPKNDMIKSMDLCSFALANWLYAFYINTCTNW